jgi:hypothetical protein
MGVPDETVDLSAMASGVRSGIAGVDLEALSSR